MTLGFRLKERREALALTQEQVGRVLGVSRELVALWESGERIPGARQLDDLARLYRVNRGYLLGKEDLDRKAEREVLYRGLPDDLKIRDEVERWLDFLDEWAELLEELEVPLSGPGRPPKPLAEKEPVTDLRRVSALAEKTRDHYKLGLDALPNLYAFLDEKGVLVYRAPLGPLGEGGVGISGAVYNHPALGFCILVNANTSPGRQVFTLAHEWAHALFHHQSGGIVCRMGDYDAKERFADAFAAHFLVPGKELRRLVENEREKGGLDAYKVLRLAAYFRVSYATVLNRLLDEKLISTEQHRLFRGYSPSAMARALGLEEEMFRIPEPHPLFLERYPVSVLEQLRRALQADHLTPAQVADLLKVDVTTVRARLLAEPPKANPLEAGEFDELPQVA